MDNALEYIKNSFELKNQGYYKPAIEMLYKALAIENDNVEILAQLAQLYYLLENRQRALHYIGKVLDINKNHLDCLELMEKIYIDEDKTKEAEAVAEKIYSISKTDKNLAEEIFLLSKIKDFDKIDKIENEISNPSDVVLYELGAANLLNENQDKAFLLFTKGYEANKSNDKILYNLGKIYFERKDFDNTKKIFKELSKINPTGDVYNYLGLLKLENGQYQQAANLFQKATELDENNADALFNLGSAYFLQGWLKEAQEIFIRAIAKKPNEESFHFSLAYLYFQKQDFKKSIFEINQIKKINDKNAQAQVLQAMIRAKNGDLIEAKEDLEKLIKAYPLDDFAFSALSKVFTELKMYNEAEQMAEHALILNGNSLTYFSELIDIEIKLKNYDNAKEYIEKLIRKNKNFVYAYIASAKINYILKDYNNLYENAQKIIDLDENSPEGYYYNSISLFEQGDTNFAIESLKKAISIDVNNAILYSKMSEFYQDLGDLENAYLWAKEASEIDEKSYKFKRLCAKIAVALKKDDDAVRFYSLAFRLGNFDEDLVLDYSRYLNSVGKTKQAKNIREVTKKNMLINKNLSIK